MRSDMGKIAVDAYRHGGHDDAKRTSKLRRGKHRDDIIDAPTKQSMSRERTGSKELGENLSPLYRWLGKQAGRRWDDVYSEMVRALGGGFTNMEHIKGHVLDRVERNEVRMIDGWPHRMLAHRGIFKNQWIEMRREELYVDDEGILRGVPTGVKPPSRTRKEEKAKQKPKVIKLDDGFAAAKVGGTWFKAELRSIPLRWKKAIDYLRCSPYKDPANIVYRWVQGEGTFVDIIWKKLGMGEPSSYDRRKAYGDSKLYASSMRTMSKKEIKRMVPEKFR